MKAINKKAKMNGARRWALCTTAIGMMLTVSSSLYAQQTSTGVSGHVEDIVITARRTTERLQETPIAVSAFSAEGIARAGVTDLKGVATITPNLSINPAKQSKSLASFIRGVGQDEDFFTFQPAVGFYLDDVYQGTAFGAGFDLVDIDRVEVLRGPQGTLFGKSTEGGAIRVFTKEPTEETDGYIEGGVGSFNRVDFRAAANLTLVPEKLFLRVSGGAVHAEGYNKIIDFACANPSLAGGLIGTGLKGSFTDCVVDKAGDINVVSVRSVLKFVANDDLSITVHGDYTNDKGGPAPDKLVAINPAVLALNNNRAFLPRQGIPVDSRFLTAPDSYTTYASFVDPDSGRRMPLKNTVIARGVSANIDWTLTENLSLKSISAYRKSSGEAAWDTDNTPFVLNHSYRQYVQSQYSQELLFNINTLEDRLRLTLGGFYFSQKTAGPSLVLTGPSGVGLAASFNDLGKDKSWSLFGHMVFDLTESLHLEAGYRHSDEDRDYTFRRDYFALFGAPTTVPTSTQEGHDDFRVGLSYDVADDIMVYGNVSTGYKAGGFNPRPTFPSQITSFDAETVTAYEGGIKSDLFDRRLRANMAVFYSRYKDVQKPAFQASTCQGTPPVCSPSFVFANVGNARIWGLEGEFEAIPVDNLSLTATFGYTNFKYTFLNALNPPGGATLNSKAPFVPKFQYALGAQYRFELPSGMSVTPRVDFTHRSRVFFGAANLIEASQPSYGLVNGRITWKSADELWSVAVSGTNLTKEFYYTYLGETLNSIGITDGQPGRPREFRLSVRREF